MLAGAGARVALFDMQAERGRQVAAEIRGLFCEADVTSEASVAAALAAARAANGVERIAVNCAGIVIGRRTVSKKRDGDGFVPHDLASFQKVLNVNLAGTFNVIAQSAAGMAALAPADEDGQRGVIVCTSSVAAEDGQMGQAAYSASKAGVAGMILPIARDLAPLGVRIAAILPGLYHTPMFDGLPDEARKALAASIPFPSRLGRPSEYAAMVRSIVENDMFNGTSVRLDGALRMAAK